MSEIILIGLGGTGSNTVAKTVDLFERRAGEEDSIHALTIDLEEQGIGGGDRIREFNGLGVKQPKSLVEHHWEQDEYFPRWWPTQRKDGEPYTSFQDLTSGSKAAQIRPNGRLASVLNFQGLKSEVEDIFEEPLEAVENPEGEREGLYAFLITTLGGGTGSGILHDVAYLCRAQMTNNDYLVGVFFDGTVVKSFAPDKTGILSYASLVEIDHWMRRPEDYFEVPAVDHDVTRNYWNQHRDEDRFIDFAFLVQERNKNDLLLSGKSTGRIKGDYQKLASEWLYAFLQGDLLTRGDRDARVFENTVPSLLRHARGDGRPELYGSFGSTVLSVPVHKITEYLTAVRQDQAFTTWRNEDIDLERGRAYLADVLDIDEGRESSLSRKWRQANLKAVDRLLEKLETAGQLVRNAESHDELENAVGSADLTSAGIESEWLKLLDSFEDRARAYLTEEDGLLDRVVGRIDREVNQSLLGGGRAGLPAHPSDAADWLESLLSGIESVKQELERQKGSVSLDPVGEAAAEVKDASLFQKLFRSGALRDRMARQVSRLRRRVRQEELALMTEFYEDLEQRIRQRVDFLGLLEDGLDGVEAQAQEDRDHFQFDSDIVNPEALREDEHPLELQVGTNRDYVERVREELADRHVTTEQVIQPVVGGGHLADHSSWKGLAQLYRDEIGEFEAVREEGRGYDRVGLQSTIESKVRDILSERVGNEVEKVVRERFDVEGALDSFLENKYREASSYDPDDPADETVLERFEAQFGGNGARKLLSETDDREAWVREALVHLFDRLVTFASPFWNQIEKYRNETLSDGGEVRRNFLQIFVPRDSSLDRRLLEAGVLDHVESPNDEPLAAFEDPYSLPIVQLEFGYPIHSVAELDIDRARYLSHLRAWRSGESSGPPYHVDRRFYEEWSDDLSEPEPVNQQSQEDAFLLYVLGLGTGTIEVVSNGSNRYKFDGSTIDSSVKGVIEALSEDRDLRGRVRSEIFRAMSTPLGNASQSTAARKDVWSVYHEGSEIHGDLQPPQANEEHFRLWESVREAVEIRTIGDGEYRTEGRLVPTRPAEFEELRERLKG